MSFLLLKIRLLDDHIIQNVDMFRMLTRSNGPIVETVSISIERTPILQRLSEVEIVGIIQVI